MEPIRFVATAVTRGAQLLRRSIGSESTRDYARRLEEEIGTAILLGRLGKPPGGIIGPRHTAVFRWSRGHARPGNYYANALEKLRGIPLSAWWEGER